MLCVCVCVCVLWSVDEVASAAPPRFVVRPADTVVAEAASLVLHCAANGRDRSGAAPRVVWLRDGSTVDLPYVSRLMGLLQLRFELDSSTIRARFEHDTSTARYNTLRGFSCARIRDRFEHSTRISGRRVLHVD